MFQPRVIFKDNIRLSVESPETFEQRKEDEVFRQSVNIFPPSSNTRFTIEIQTTNSSIDIKLIDTEDLLSLWIGSISEEKYRKLQTDYGVLIGFFNFPNRLAEIFRSVIKGEGKLPSYSVSIAYESQKDGVRLAIKERDSFKETIILGIELLKANESEIRGYLSKSIAALKTETETLKTSIRRVTEESNRTKENVVKEIEGLSDIIGGDKEIPLIERAKSIMDGIIMKSNNHEAGEIERVKSIINGNTRRQSIHETGEDIYTETKRLIGYVRELEERLIKIEGSNREIIKDYETALYNEKEIKRELKATRENFERIQEMGFSKERSEEALQEDVTKANEIILKMKKDIGSLKTKLHEEINNHLEMKMKKEEIEKENNQDKVKVKELEKLYKESENKIKELEEEKKKQLKDVEEMKQSIQGSEKVIKWMQALIPDESLGGQITPNVSRFQDNEF